MPRLTTQRHAGVVLLLLPLLASCHPQTRADAPTAGLTVLDVASSVYQPAAGSRATPSEASMCKAWSLDKVQAASLLRLSRPLREGELHDFNWLPCSIQARVQVDTRVLDVEINAAGTSIWRAGNDSVMQGCAMAACQPFVLLMPDSLQP